MYPKHAGSAVVFNHICHHLPFIIAFTWFLQCRTMLTDNLMHSYKCIRVCQVPLNIDENTCVIPTKNGGVFARRFGIEEPALLGSFEQRLEVGFNSHPFLNGSI